MLNFEVRACVVFISPLFIPRLVLTIHTHIVIQGYSGFFPDSFGISGVLRSWMIEAGKCRGCISSCDHFTHMSDWDSSNALSVVRDYTWHYHQLLYQPFNSLFPSLLWLHSTFCADASDGERDDIARLLCSSLSPPRWPICLQTLQGSWYCSSILHLYHRSVKRNCMLCFYLAKREIRFNCT